MLLSWYTILLFEQIIRKEKRKMNELILLESLRSLFNLELENSFNVNIEYNFII